MQISEEEAIEQIKKLLENTNPFTMPPHIHFSLKTALNLIEKQDEEMKRLKEIAITKTAKSINEILDSDKKHNEELIVLNEQWKLEMANKNKEIETQSKMIDELVKYIATGKCYYGPEEEIREVFRKKVGNNESND